MPFDSRVVDVSTKGDPGYGTGYLVGDGLVLTALHVVAQGAPAAEPTAEQTSAGPIRPHGGITVRILGTDRWLDSELVWPLNGETAAVDAALLRITDITGDGRLTPPAARWGRPVTAAMMDCHSTGFPVAQRRFGNVRDTEELHAQVAPLTRSRDGHFQLSVERDLPDLPGSGSRAPGVEETSPWSGMSGAALLCSGMVVGLLIEDRRRYGPASRRLTAVRTERLFTEPGFRTAIRGNHDTEPILEAVEFAHVLAPPAVPRRPGSVAGLLRADHEIVRFRGRATEIERLRAWCDGDGVSVRLLIGPGGAGKTRLARELAARLQRSGWTSGLWLGDSGTETLRAYLTDLHIPTLLVIDYAEQRANAVRQIIRAAQGHRHTVPLRVLLVARSADGWWENTKRSGEAAVRDMLGTAEIDPLSPLAADPDDRQAFFAEAVEDLGAALRKITPDCQPTPVQPPDLTTDAYGSVLTIQTEALARLLSPSRKGDSASAEDVVLDHEQVYWTRTAPEHGVTVHPRTQRLAVAVAALCGSAGESEAVRLLEHVPGLHDQSHDQRLRVATWLRDLYPAEGAAGAAFWGSLQPDLLSEHLIGTVAQDDRDLLFRIVRQAAPGQVERATIVLARASMHQPHIAEGLTRLLATLPPDLEPLADPAQFIERARGRGPGAVRASGYFCGRTRPLRELSGWIDGPLRTGDSVRVVTGGAGSGKSTLIAMLMCATHPELRAAARPIWSRAAYTPRPQRTVVALYARDRDLEAIRAALARQVGLIGLGEPTPDLETVLTHLGNLPEPPLVVLDGIDESPDASSVVTTLLQPLALGSRSDGGPLCRLLLGARPGLSALLDWAAGRVVDLSLVPEDELRADLTAYLTSVLSTDDRYNPAECPGLGRVIAGAAATTLARESEGPFLVAAMFAFHLLNDRRTDLPTTVAEGMRLGESVPASVADMLELDLASRSESVWLRPALACLAPARGAGMPISLIEDLAQAFAPPGTASPDPEEIGEAIRDAGFYLQRAREADGTALYRLYHQGLVEHLAIRPHPPAARWPGAGPAYADTSANLVLNRLVPSGTSWADSTPYARRHAIQHAMIANRADELITDEEFLPHADPDTLIPELRHARSEEARLAAAVYRASAAQHRALRPEERRTLLTVDAARYGAASLLARLNGKHSNWQVLWASGQQTGLALRSSMSMGSGITAMTATELNGRTVVVVGRMDGALGIVDLESTALVGSLMIHDERYHDTRIPRGDLASVVDVDVTTIDGRPVAVCGYYDGTVRIWDLSASRSGGEPLTRCGQGVMSIRCAIVDDVPLAVICTSSGELTKWDLRRRVAIGDSAEVSDRSIMRLAITELNGRTVLIHGGGHSPVTIRDLVTLRPIPQQPMAFSVHTYVMGLATAELAGLPIVVVCSEQRILASWDLETAEVLNWRINAHPSHLSGLACGEMDGSPIAVTSDENGTLRVWSLCDGEPLGAPLAGHSAAVDALTYAEAGGVPLVISGDRAGVIRTWDLTMLEAPRTPQRPGHERPIDAVAIGGAPDRPRVISGSRDGAVQVWDALTGEPLARLFDQLTVMPNVIACTQARGRYFALVAGDGGENGIEDLVWVFDLDTLSRVGSMAGHKNVISHASCTTLDGRPMGVTCARFASYAGDGIRVWWLDDCTPFGLIEPDRDNGLRDLTGVTTATVEDRPIIIAPHDGEGLACWDLATGTRLVNIEVPAPLNSVLATISSGSAPFVLIAGESSDGAWVVDLAAQRRSDPPLAHPGGVLALACSQIGGRPTVFSGARDGTVAIFDLLSRERLEQLHFPGRINGLAVNDNGLLAVACGQEIILLRRETRTR
ncbi:hypothetical protein ACRYCC_10565 [Actinomadura scrupuli]|uniref:P-loop NTPase n=1 Tax=Actinomadura scrupuli TaxID=559629 RepID=UPI003D97F581